MDRVFQRIHSVQERTDSFLHAIDSPGCFDALWHCRAPRLPECSPEVSRRKKTDASNLVAMASNLMDEETEVSRTHGATG